eukprot:IDg13988t1
MDYNLCDLNATRELFHGGVELPLSAVRTYEWRIRVLFRSKYLYPATDYDRGTSACASYTKKIVQSSCRYGTFNLTVDLSFGDVAEPRFSAKLLTEDEIAAPYSSMSLFWKTNFSYKYSALLPSLTYLAEHLVDRKPNSILPCTDFIRYGLPSTSRVGPKYRIRNSASRRSSALILGAMNTSKSVNGNNAFADRRSRAWIPQRG